MAPPKNVIPAGFARSKGVLKKKSVSKSKKAQIIFPVTRVRKHLKVGNYAKRIQVGSSVYLAAVLEYLAAEVTELAGNTARDNNRQRIIPRHIMIAVRTDAELDQLFNGITISQGGVLPNIQPVLLKTKTTKSKARSAKQSSEDV